MELIKAHSLFRHGIKVGCLEIGVPIVGHVTPALVIRHDEHNVRRCGRDGMGRQCSEDKSGQEFHGMDFSQSVNQVTRFEENCFRGCNQARRHDSSRPIERGVEQPGSSSGS